MKKTQILLDGMPVHTSGSLPAVGAVAPGFLLTAADLSEATLASFAGQRKILNITPSLETSVCGLSARTFDAGVSKLNEVVLINISADLPFAQKRFCESHSLKNIVTLSTFRSPDFGRAYGVEMVDGAFRGLLSRAVLVLDRADRVVYAQQVPEIGQEPDYAAALAALRHAP